MSDKVQAYAWSGINKQGNRVKGVVQAADERAAELELKSLDIEVISLKLKSKLFAFGPKKITSKEIVFFTRYISTMISAGMPIIQALDVISRDQENETLESVVVSLRASISSGTTFADSLSHYPEYFNPLFCNLVRAGEKSGTLDKVLKRIADYLEKGEILKRKIRNALIYPATIVAVALIVSLILLLFVIPQFETLFTHAHTKLPGFTMAVVHLSNYIRSYWWMIILVLVVIIWGMRYLLRTNENFAYKFDELSLRTVIIGNILKKATIARFTSTLAITLDAGVPIVDAMKTMVNIVGNRVYTKAILHVCDELVSGHPLSRSMADTNCFPNMVIQMVAVGEASGELPKMLNTIAGYYQDEVNSIADNLSTILEPLIIVVLGVIIGAFVIAMYLPIFKMGTTV